MNDCVPRLVVARLDPTSLKHCVVCANGPTRMHGWRKADYNNKVGNMPYGYFAQPGLELFFQNIYPWNITEIKEMLKSGAQVLFMLSMFYGRVA